jgi:hypothetical protein
MTASAVWDDTVSPAAPIAIPRSASASAGASLTPSRDQNVSFARSVAGARDGGFHLVSRDADLPEERATPDGDRSTVRLALDALPWLLANDSGCAKRQVTVIGGADERLAEHMGRDLIDGRREREDLVTVDAVARDDVAHGGSSNGERSGVVKQDRRGMTDRLNPTGALHDHTCPGGPRETRCDRRSEDQRAWRRDDQHREGPDRIALTTQAQAATTSVAGRKNPA